MEHSVELEVPLPTAAQARALYNTLRPDPELRPSEFSKTLKLHDNIVEVSLEGVTERTLRVGVNGFMDTLREALECMAEFDPEYYHT